jgi:hypothetical protein
MVNVKRTGRITWATAIEVVVTVTVLIVGISIVDGVGAVVAAVALLLGRLGANLYLLPPLRNLPPKPVQ